METFHISTMTQISSWWSWFSLWWTVEWLARQCSLTSEVIHSSCCQKGLPAIIGLWLCNIWNNQQRRRQILLLVSDFVRCTFKIVSFLLLFTIHISQHNLLGGDPAVYDKGWLRGRDGQKDLFWILGNVSAWTKKPSFAISWWDIISKFMVWHTDVQSNAIFDEPAPQNWTLILIFIKSNLTKSLNIKLASIIKPFPVPDN